MNFTDINPKLCHLCGTCVGICPSNALKIQNETIFFDNRKCISCGFCYEYCSGQSVDFNQLNSYIFNGVKNDDEIGKFKSCCSAHSNDYNIRKNGASGGLVTSLLIYALEKKYIDGAVVVTSDLQNNGKPKIHIAKNNNDIISAAQSKYCLIPINSILKKLEKLDGKYAIVALPCQIHALRKLQMNGAESVKNVKYIFGLFCGYNMHYSATEFVRNKLKIKAENVKTINYRDLDWPGGLTFCLKNGSKIGIDSLHYHYLNPIFLPYRCRYCPDFSAEYSDISFGDSWLKDLYHKNKEINTGWSNIVVRTNKGDKLLRNAINDHWITANDISIDDLRRSYKFNLKYKKRGVFVRLKSNQNLPTYVGLNKVDMSIKEYIYHLIYYGLLIIGSSKFVIVAINYIPINILKKSIKILKYIMGYPSTAREKVSSK